MMKNLFIIFMVFISSIMSFSQEVKDFTELSQRAQVFYKNSSYAELHAYMTFMYKEKDTLRLKSILYPFTGFFTGAFSVYKDSVDLEKVLEEEFPNFNIFQVSYQLSQELPKFQSSQKLIPATNDMYWGAFLGSGDNVYLKILINRLEYINEKDSLDIYHTGITAMWSICANANQDSVIKERILKLAIEYPETTAYEIRRIVAMTPAEAKKEMQFKILDFLEQQKKRQGTNETK